MWQTRVRAGGGHPDPVTRHHPRAAALTVASLALAALSLATVLTGCSGRPGPTNAHSSPSADLRAQVEPIWAQMTQCMRTHGYPNWPDAVIGDNGQGTYPDVAGLDQKTAIDQLQATCGQILGQLPAQARPNQQPVTAAQLATLRQFAQCMRTHGEPDWPDPNADGGFPLAAEIKTHIGTTGVPPACRAIYSGSIAIDQP